MPNTIQEKGTAMPAKLTWVVPIGAGNEIRPWLEFRKAKRLSPGTIEQNLAILLQLSAYLWSEHRIARLCDAGVVHLEAWQHALYARKLSKSSIEKRLDAPKQFYAWLEKSGEIFENPAKGLKSPIYHRPLLWTPSEAQMRTLLLSINGDGPVDLRDRALLEIAYATGFRRHELLAMNLDSLDLSQGTARIVGKGRKERIVPLTRAAIAATRLYLEKSRPILVRSGAERQVALWISSHGCRRMHMSTVVQQVRRRGLTAGVKITLHAIRRAFATHLLRGGASVAEIKELLGHASYRHIGHYLRTAPMELQAAHRKSRLSQ